MHSEWLLSGSLDQSMRLWSLNVTSPTTQAMSGQIAYCTQGLISGVKSGKASHTKQTSSS